MSALPSAAAKAAGATSLPTYSRTALVLLVLVNALPLLGVAFFDWDLFSIMLLYWIENLIIGLLNIPKMLLAGTWGDKAPDEVKYDPQFQLFGRIFLSGFFGLHYGGFCFGHGIFVYVLFGRMFRVGLNPLDLLYTTVEVVSTRGLWLPIAALLVSHGVSFVFNYIGRGEYRTAIVGEVMFRPYSRVVVLHSTILFGGFLAMALGAPVVALALLIVLKTAGDVKAHLREHSKSHADLPLTLEAAAE